VKVHRFREKVKDSSAAAFDPWDEVCFGLAPDHQVECGDDGARLEQCQSAKLSGESASPHQLKHSSKCKN
jgi:hypothetical protein